MMVLVVFFSACGGEDSYVPKPRIFPKIELEAKYYTQVKSDDLHARFELPGYAVIKQDSQNAAPRQGWANIIYKPYDATLHLTHYSFQQWSVYGSKQWGLVYRIKGNTANNLNFFITDSARNFVRGALYFNHATNPDSIAPVYDYIEQDIFHMIKTFQWQ
jgi:hypothetical protein